MLPIAAVHARLHVRPTDLVLSRSGGFGLVGNVVVGIVGAFVGGWLLPQLGLFPGGNLAGQLISATAGAVVLLLLITFVRRRVA